MRRRIMEMHVLVSLQPHVAFWLVGREIVENDMDFALRMRGDDMVHEVQELDPPAPLVVPSDDLAAGEIERREERRRAMPFVIVRLAGHGAPTGQLQIPLRAFKRLYRGLFIDGKHNGVVRRRHVEADDVGRLRGKVRIVADAPRLAAAKIDLLGSQETPDMLNMDVTERPGQQWSGPVGMARRRLSVEQRQNARVVFGPVFGRRAPLARVLEADHAGTGEANTPFGRRADRAANCSGDLARRGAVPSHHNNASTLPFAMLRPLRTRQNSQFSPLTGGQDNRCRVGNALHASLNHDS